MSYDPGMRLLAAAIALGVFIVSPGFGCGDDFDFGPDEMKRAAEGTWELSLEGDSAPRAILVLSHDVPASASAGWPSVAAAHACGNRTFITSAGACGSTTTMSFHVETLKAEAPFAPSNGAGLLVFGSSFLQGELTVGFTSTGRLTLQVKPDGTVERAVFFPAQQGPATPGVRAVRRP